MIKISNLNAFYGKHQILQNINFSVEPGKCLFILGPNGCGKSTLLSLISKTDSKNLKSSGQILLNGTEIHKMPTKKLAQNIAFMSQTEISSWNLSCKDIILSGRFCHTNFTGHYSQEDKEIVNQVAAEIGITHLLERNVHTLSGGEFQKVRIARTFTQKTPVILMDEPTSSLDFGVEYSLLKQIKTLAKEKNVGVLISIHDINLASIFADEILLLAPFKENLEKQFFLGTANDILKPDILESVYGRNFGIFTHPEYNCPAVYVTP